MTNEVPAIDRRVIKRCPAKINLALSVGAPQPDGLHPIASWMVCVDLYDDLIAQRLDAQSPSDFDLGWADDAPSPSPIDWPIPADLACQACIWTEHFTARPLPVHVTLQKRIPVGAGMAGGSSNAAAMIDALNELYDLNLKTEDRCAIGARVGSDVPFFFAPDGALVGGIGGDIQPLPKSRTLHLTLITPPIGCPTGQVYRAFDELFPNAELNTQRVASLTTGSLAPEDLFNDLAEAAFVVRPELRGLRNQCAKITGRTVHVTGSGAGMFIVSENADTARQMAEKITRDAPCPARAVQTI